MILENIISAFDEGFERTKRESLPLTKEEWQTIRAAVLGTTPNKPSAKPCAWCRGRIANKGIFANYCPLCGFDLRTA